jgi:hypothetical protein
VVRTLAVEVSLLKLPAKAGAAMLGQWCSAAQSEAVNQALTEAQERR